MALSFEAETFAKMYEAAVVERDQLRESIVELRAEIASLQAKLGGTPHGATPSHSEFLPEARSVPPIPLRALLSGNRLSIRAP